MIYQDSKAFEIENVGTAERAVRGTVGLIAMEAVLLIPALAAAGVAGLSMLALYMVFTAITGWDPFYAALTRKFPAQPAPVPAVIVRPRNGERQIDKEYKRAA
jgi:hypothetical protein